MEELMMKTMMKHKQKQAASSQTTTSSSLSLHKNSQVISKVKPKIRIIHIFAPEIIKTDAANFRELVQRLTGKSAADDHMDNHKIKKPTRLKNHHYFHDQTSVVTKKVEMGSGFCNGFGYKDHTIVKEEEGFWQGGNSAGFLTGFADLDGLFQELGGFPMEVNLMQGLDGSQLT